MAVSSSRGMLPRRSSLFRQTLNAIFFSHEPGGRCVSSERMAR